MKKEEIRALEERYARLEIPVVSNNSAHRFTPDVPMEFSGMDMLLEDASEESFSDCIYGIRQKRTQFSLLLQSALHHTDAFDYLKPP